MPNFFSTLALFSLVILQVSKSSNYSGRCRYALHLTDDGPVTLDVPVTISAQLDCTDNTIEYIYVFEDDTHRSFEVPGHESAEASFIFTENPGIRSIEVTVYRLRRPLLLVATASASIHVEDYIPGTLNFSGIIINKDGRGYIGSDWTTNITLELHYPLHVLQDSEFSYSWAIGEHRFSTDKSFTLYRFTDPGQQSVRISVVGRIPSYDGSNTVRYKWGYFDEDIMVKDSFASINISGNTYLEHGQLLDLQIFCNGSGPVEYCWKILPVTENNTNLSCTDPMIGTECVFPILYYFRDSGHFLLAIHVNNFVSSLQRNVEVHIYDVSLRRQLSTVIIPLVCTVLVVFIIAFAVVVQMRRNRSLDVETADFDFMQMEESAVAVESSWEVLRRSILHILQVHCFCYPSEPGTSGSSYGTILVNK